MADENVAQAAGDEELPAGVAETTDDTTEGQDTAASGAEGGSEAFARRLGWRPETEWTGPPERKPARFLSPDEYIEKVQTETPVMRERLRYQDQEIARRDQLINEFNSRFTEQGQEIRRLMEMTRGARQTDYQRSRRELEMRMDTAASQADLDAYNRAKAEINALDQMHWQVMQAPDGGQQAQPQHQPAQRTQPQQQQQPPVQFNPAIKAWIDQNEWYTRDPELNAVANSMDGLLMAQHPGMSVADRLEEVRNRIVARYPEKFGNPRRAAPSAVAAPTNAAAGAAAKGVKKTIRDLPNEARQELAKFKRLIPGYTDEEYLKDYPW